MNNNSFIKRIFSSSKEDESIFDNVTENLDANTQEQFDIEIKIKEKYKVLENQENKSDLFFYNNDEISKELKQLLEKISFDSVYMANSQIFFHNYNYFYGFKKRFTILVYSLIISIFTLFSVKYFFTISFNQLLILMLPIMANIFCVTKEYLILKKIALNLPIPNELIKKFIFKSFHINIPFFNKNISYSQIAKKENFQMLYNFFKSRPETDIFYYFKEYVNLKNPNNKAISDIEKFHLQKFGEYISSILRYKKIIPKNNKHKSFEQLEYEATVEQSLSSNQSLIFFMEEKKSKNSTKQ